MSSYVTRKTDGDTAWFTHDRFGMFIHFGLYAMPARGEWVKTQELITEEKYDKYMQYFNPDLFDAKEWARKAKEAGMKYVVLTAKHHEGFCMWDSDYTDYKITNTPFGRDLVKEYADAFREVGLRVGIYYSLIDWHHPLFPVDWTHPRRHDNGPEMNKTRDIKAYAEYMRNQVRELLTNYGKIDIIWFDYTYPERPIDLMPVSARTPLRYHSWAHEWMEGKSKDDWESEKLIALIRSINPDIIINNRTGIDQDLWTPEQYTPTDWVKHPETGELVVWESCQTFSGKWGYHRDEMSWKSPKMLIELLINNVSCGGNLIMNVGPTARGNFDKRADNALGVFAEWMKYNSRSIYGCTMREPEIKEPRGTRITQSEDGKRLYIHLFEYPNGFIKLEGMGGKVDYVQFLHDASEIPFTDKQFVHMGDTVSGEKDNDVVINVPKMIPDMVVPVIEIFLK